MNKLYAILFAGQAAGASLILLRALPIYRVLLLNPSAYQPELPTEMVACAGMSLILATYYLRHRFCPELVLRRRVPLAHLVWFIGRLSFIFVSAMFSVIFYVRFDQVEFSFPKLTLLLCVLFAMFCHTLEWEHLAKALLEGRKLSSKATENNSTERANDCAGADGSHSPRSLADRAKTSPAPEGLPRQF